MERDATLFLIQFESPLITGITPGILKTADLRHFKKGKREKESAPKSEAKRS